MCAARAEEDPESQDEEDDPEDEDFQYYYENEFDNDVHDSSSDCKKDPEYFDFECLHVADVDRLLNESVEAVCSQLTVTPSIAKVSGCSKSQVMLTDITPSLWNAGPVTHSQMEHRLRDGAVEAQVLTAADCSPDQTP